MARTAFVLVLATGLGVAAGAAPNPRASQATSLLNAETTPAVVVQEYAQGVSACTANQDVRLSVIRDPASPDERVLLVEYPAPGTDPAARDVRCTAQQRDWTAGRAIAFHVRPDHPMRMSVSFFDRNRVAYTAWRDLKGGEWQLVQIPFDEIRPNPFFQLPGANTGAAIDVSDVSAILFAPQDQTSGRLAVGRFVVSR